MDCPSLNSDGYCSVISMIAGKNVKPHPSTCTRCGGTDKPNKSTVCGAMNAHDNKHIKHAIKDKYIHFFDTEEMRVAQAKLYEQLNIKPRPDRLAEVQNGNGVGSHMWRLLSELGIEHNNGCKCLALAIKMNEWGPDGCRSHKKEIVSDMRENAKSYGWSSVTKAAVNAFKNGVAWRLNLADIYGSLLDEAIRRTEVHHAAC